MPGDCAMDTSWRHRSDDDAMWGACKVLLHCEASPKEIAAILRVSARFIRDAEQSQVPPSRRATYRTRNPSAKTARCRAARREKVVSMLLKKTYVTGLRRVYQKGAPRKDPNWVRPFDVVKRRDVKMKFSGPRAVAREMNQSGHVISASTVRRDAHAYGLAALKRPTIPRLDAEHKQARVRTFRPLLRKPLKWFDKLILTDEKWFDSNTHHNHFQWAPATTKRDDLLPRYSMKFPPKIMIWAAIGVGFRKCVVMTDTGDTIDHQVYLDKCLIPLRAFLKKRVLMHDDAPGHIHDGVASWIRTNKIEVCPWAPKSADANPLENLWALLSHRVSDCGPWDKHQLTDFVHQEFEAIPQEVIDKFVRSVKKRMTKIVETGGEFMRDV